MRRINEIIIHCTATPEGRDVSVADIDHCHRQRGFNGIGYHYVVMLDGQIEAGRTPSAPGAHCLGHNAHSIGIAYVGGVAKDGKTPKDTRTDAQKKALRELVSTLRAQFPGATVHGHNEYAAKACPCFDVRKEFPDE